MADYGIFAGDRDRLPWNDFQLLAAAERNDLAGVRQALRDRANVNAVKDEKTALINAAFNCNAEMIRELVRAGADRYFTYHRQTAYEIALEGCDENVLDAFTVPVGLRAVNSANVRRARARDAAQEPIEYDQYGNVVMRMPEVARPPVAERPLNPLAPVFLPRAAAANEARRQREAANAALAARLAAEEAQRARNRAARNAAAAAEARRQQEAANAALAARLAAEEAERAARNAAAAEARRQQEAAAAEARRQQEAANAALAARLAAQQRAPAAAGIRRPPLAPRRFGMAPILPPAAIPGAAAAVIPGAAAARPAAAVIPGAAAARPAAAAAPVPAPALPGIAPGEPLPPITPARPAPVPAAARNPQSALAHQFDFTRLLLDRPPARQPGNRFPPGYNYSMCPVCMEVFQEEEIAAANCIYHSHSCLPGRRNERLWQKYRNSGGANKIDFCFTCGRPAEGHRHFTLQGGNARPVLIYPRNPWNCEADGGGGRRELIARILGIIARINFFEGQPIRENKEFFTACTDFGENAAMDPRFLAGADQSLRENRFQLQITRNIFFIRNAPAAPVAVDPAAAAADAAAFNRAGCPAGHHIPERIERPTAELRRLFPCTQCMGEERDEPRPVYRLRHRNEAGNDYTHPNNYLICGEHLADYIEFNINRRSALCFQPTADGCGGSIHPCEIRNILTTDLYKGEGNPQATVADRQALYNRYRDMFRQLGGGKKQTKKSKKRKALKTRSKKI